MKNSFDQKQYKKYRFKFGFARTTLTGYRKCVIISLEHSLVDPDKMLKVNQGKFSRYLSAMKIRQLLVNQNNGFLNKCWEHLFKWKNNNRIVVFGGFSYYPTF